MYKLDFDIDSYFSYKLIGIITGVPDYQIAHHINKLFDFSLTRTEGHILKTKKQTSVHDCLKHENDYVNIHLIKNSSNITRKYLSIEKSSVMPDFEDIYGFKSFYMIPCKKHIDFLLTIDFKFEEIDINLIINKLNKLEFVGLSIHLPMDKLKHKENLII